MEEEDAETSAEVAEGVGNLEADIEKIMQDEGVVIQPYWRSTYRHTKPGVMGAEQHPTFEIYPAKLGWAG